jgi:hypothetical protein
LSFGDDTLTEPEWQACNNPAPMIRALPAERYERELRLFCVGCVRGVWDLLPDACRRAVEVAERFARGTTSQSDLRAAFDAAAPVIDEVWSGGRSPDARAYATQAVGDAAAPWPRTVVSILSACGAAASAVGCVAAEAAGSNYDTAFEAARAAELGRQAVLLRELVPYPGESAAT